MASGFRASAFDQAQAALSEVEGGGVSSRQGDADPVCETKNCDSLVLDDALSLRW